MRTPLYSIEEFANRVGVPAPALKLALLTDPDRPKPVRIIVRNRFEHGRQRVIKDPGYPLPELERWFKKECSVVQEIAA